MSTIRKNDGGRYIAAVPFKNNEEIVTSRNIVMAQFLRIERMFTQKPELKKQNTQTCSNTTRYARLQTRKV